MNRSIALLLVAAVSFATFYIVWGYPDWVRDNTEELALFWAVLGIPVLASVPDNRMNPWFARLGGRLFLGRGVGLILSIAFTICIGLACWIWAAHLQHGKLVGHQEFERQLIFLVLILAPWEEIWWRGVWFAAASKHYWTQVLLGSFLFAAGHAHRAFQDAPDQSAQGWVQVAVLLVLGVSFASLRRAGAPLVVLIPLHGLANLLVWLTSRAPDSDALAINATIITVCLMALAAIGVGFGPPRDETPIE